MKTITEPTVFAGIVEFTKIPTRRLTKFTPADTTPSVKDNEWFQTTNTGAVTVTQFNNGQELQRLHILGDGFTTVANNANIKTNTGANKLLAANKVYKFTNFGKVWIEDV
jgi:hypothetical protein